MAKRAVTIVEAAPEHATSISEVNRAAFQGKYEADLVGRLQSDGRVVLSLVALRDAEVVGHLLFSDVDVDVDGRRVRTLALAPMSVAPKAQGKGVGSALLKDGLKRLTGTGYEAVLVLGHPEYYPRFGFSAALTEKFASPFPRDAFMALELVPGALQGTRGTVTYPKAFGLDA